MKIIREFIEFRKPKNPRDTILGTYTISQDEITSSDLATIIEGLSSSFEFNPNNINIAGLNNQEIKEHKARAKAVWKIIKNHILSFKVLSAVNTYDIKDQIDKIKKDLKNKTGIKQIFSYYPSHYTQPGQIFLSVMFPVLFTDIKLNGAETISSILKKAKK